MAKKYKNRVKSEVKKGLKKNIGAVIIILCVTLVFALAGFLTCKVMTKNDGLVLTNANKVVEIPIGGVYTEEGATFTGFGKDMSKFIKIEIKNGDGETITYIPTDSDAIFSIIYSVASASEVDGLSLFEKLTLKKFEDYTLIRTIIVGEGA